MFLAKFNTFFPNSCKKIALFLKVTYIEIEIFEKIGVVNMYTTLDVKNEPKVIET